MDKEIRLSVEPSYISSRLDTFLTKQFPDYSRTYFQDLIGESVIKINGLPVKKASRALREDDEICFIFPAPKKYNIVSQKVDFGVVDTQEDFLIVNKPAGLVVHPPDKNSFDKPSLVAGLLHDFEEFSQFGASERPGLVHRLDRETSGLMVISRSIPSQIVFSEMFKDRKMSKTYLTIVKGHPPKEGSIRFPIGRDPHNPTKMSHRGIGKKDALTHYKVLSYYDEYALVQARIVTGRTHQIRVHFAALGHSVVGDTVYGTSSKLISRQALHAWKISFEYKNQSFSYSQDVPEDFKVALGSISPK
jgi:23S rRNA pseudouridine1911/1915/1917 synthase